MTVIDHDEPIAIDALVVDVPTDDVQTFDAHVPEALIVDVDVRDVASVRPVAGALGAAGARTSRARGCRAG